MKQEMIDALCESSYEDSLKILQKETDDLVKQLQRANAQGLETLAGFLEQKICAHTAAVAAVKKRIPMEVPTEDLHYDYYVCPACFNENDCDEYDIPDNCCPECGQRIFSRGVVLEDEEQW